MITQLSSYKSFTKRIDKILCLFNTHIPGIYEMDREVTDILEVARKHHVPGIDPIEKSIHALLLSIAANAKASRAHYIALRAHIEVLNDFINLCQGS